MRTIHTGFHAILNSVFLFLIVATLAACTSGGGYDAQQWQTGAANQTAAQQAPDDLNVPASVPGVEAQGISADNMHTTKVAILLPLSGQHADLGQAMLSAAQMALFDVGHNNLELMPRDTGGTATGARNAAQSAIQNGAQLVLGPLFSYEVKAAKPVVQNANVNMIAFSTDWTLADDHTFLIGFLPFDQVERVTRYAVAKGNKRIGVLSPSDSYGNGVVSAYKAVGGHLGLSSSRIERFAPQGGDLSLVIRKFADYDQRKAAKNAYGAPFDAVLMPVGGTMARSVGSFLSQYDLPPGEVRRLGTGLMDESGLAGDPSLQGAWFAAPDPQARKDFENRYRKIYASTPPRLSSLSYDATALAAILARTGLQQSGRPAFTTNAITNPNGFAGVDGIFRFRPDGIVERGMAILTFENGRERVIDPAPRTFQRYSAM
ncbi:MAG: penicillin-binding protein activator [Alphaproteobacteria bacterium]|nr:penicillin-binding protein activator [Alphaproteobacteria bacterium]